MASWPTCLLKGLSDESFLAEHRGVKVSVPLLWARSAQGILASTRTELEKGDLGYGGAELHRLVRRMGKIKSQTSGRIPKGEPENYRTGDAKKTLEQERRGSDQRNGLGKKPKQAVMGMVRKAGLCVWNSKGRKI